MISMDHSVMDLFGISILMARRILLHYERKSCILVRTKVLNNLVVHIGIGPILVPPCVLEAAL